MIYFGESPKLLGYQHSLGFPLVGLPTQYNSRQTVWGRSPCWVNRWGLSYPRDVSNGPAPIQAPVNVLRREVPMSLRRMFCRTAMLFLTLFALSVLKFCNLA